MSGISKQTKLRIRLARKGDVARLAELAGQLGYPSTAKQLRERLRALKPAHHHAVFVADDPSAGVVGWLHVSIWPLLESDLRAEVNGLVVDETQRSLGAGAQLLAAAEKWARQRRCRSMNVRSNVIRERAHKFYECNAYEHYKTQKSFRKSL
jgi:GNAT superfamily N-acetyltransferase